MRLDLNSGVNIEISGELGKFQSIPIDDLINISRNLQNLVNSIAKYDLPGDEGIDQSNFKLELCGFVKSSAVPQYKFTPRIQFTTSDYLTQRNLVSQRLDSLMSVADKGDYTKIKDLYPDAFRRNIIVQDLFNFANSFQTSPVNFVGIENERLTPIYKIHRFKSKTKADLISDIKDEKLLEWEESGIAKFKDISKGGKVRRKTIGTFKDKDAAISYAPKSLTFNNRTYHLSVPLRSLFDNEDDFYIIQNELIDIIGTGITPQEAEEDFAEEFDYIYRTYTSTPDFELSERLVNIKRILGFIVDNIEE